MRAASWRRLERASRRRFSAPTSNKSTVRHRIAVVLASSTSARVRSGPTLPNERYVRCRSVTTSGASTASRTATSAAASTTAPTTPPCSAPIEFFAQSRTGSSTTPHAASTVAIPTRSNNGAVMVEPSSAIVDGPAERTAPISGLASRRGSTEKLIVATPTDRSWLAAARPRRRLSSAPRAAIWARASTSPDLAAPVMCRVRSAVAIQSGCAVAGREPAADHVDERRQRAGAHRTVVAADLGHDRQPRSRRAVRRVLEAHAQIAQEMTLGRVARHGRAKLAGGIA